MVSHVAHALSLEDRSQVHLFERWALVCLGIFSTCWAPGSSRDLLKVVCSRRCYCCASDVTGEREQGAKETTRKGKVNDQNGLRGVICNNSIEEYLKEFFARG